MEEFIHKTYITIIYNPFTYLIKTLARSNTWFYTLLVFFVILLFLPTTLKNKSLTKLKNFLGIFTIFLIISVLYVRYWPSFYESYKKNSAKNNSNTTSAPTSNGSDSNSGSQDTNTGQQSVPSYQQPKQLYYSVSCSSCWAEGCNSNGYSYGGYSEYYYIYYKSLCQSCRCNNFKAQSFWR